MFMSPDCFPSTPIFNRARLADVTLGDTALQDQLLASFLRDLPRTREVLNAGGALEPAALREVVHKLRGSCHFAGADRLAALLRGAEALIAGEEPAWREALARRILAELSVLEQELAAHLAKAD